MAKAAEAVAVATARADNNQQRAAKTAAAAIAVGKRCQARGEKQGWWRWQRRGGGRGGGCRGGSGGSNGRWGRPEVRVEIGVPRTLLGNYSVHMKAMRLANGIWRGPNVWHLDRLLPVPQMLCR